jgi:hypothetical protein
MADLFDIISTRLIADVAAGGVSEPTEGAIGGFHRNIAPEGSGFPRIHVKNVTGLPIYTMTQEYVRRTFVQFTVFAKDPQGHPGESTEAGGKKAYRLNKRVQSLFFDADITVADQAFISSRLDRELPSSTETDTANGQSIYSEGCVIEMWTT